MAVEVDLIGANIFRRVKAPKVKDADTRALSLEEAGRFFDAARGLKFEGFFRIAALTGARRGELVGLKWDAVDLDTAVLTVRTSLASTRAKRAERAGGAAAVVLKAQSPERPGKSPLIATLSLFFVVLRPPKRPRNSRSAPSTTLNLYSHVVAGGREKAVAAASDTLRRAQASHAASGK